MERERKGPKFFWECCSRSKILVSDSKKRHRVIGS
jgi:hypothetical protein